MDDLEAIRRLKQGDISGLEWLIAHHQLKAVRTAFLITHDVHRMPSRRNAGKCRFPEMAMFRSLKICYPRPDP
jgi:hypothetical protein